MVSQTKRGAVRYATRFLAVLTLSIANYLYLLTRIRSQRHILTQLLDQSPQKVNSGCLRFRIPLFVGAADRLIPVWLPWLFRRFGGGFVVDAFRVRKGGQVRRGHFPLNAVGEFAVKQIHVALSGDQLDDRVALQLFERLFEQSNRSFEVKRVLGPHENMQFPGELGPQPVPVSFEDEMDVILFPGLRDGE